MARRRTSCVMLMSLYKFASLEDEVRAYIAINIEHFQRPMWPLAPTFSKYYFSSDGVEVLKLLDDRISRFKSIKISKERGTSGWFLYCYL